jgi:hypothetical protein
MAYHPHLLVAAAVLAAIKLKDKLWQYHYIKKRSQDQALSQLTGQAHRYHTHWLTRAMPVFLLPVNGWLSMAQSDTLSGLKRKRTMRSQSLREISMEDMKTAQQTMMTRIAGEGQNMSTKKSNQFAQNWHLSEGAGVKASSDVSMAQIGYRNEYNKAIAGIAAATEDNDFDSVRRQAERASGTSDFNVRYQPTKLDATQEAALVLTRTTRCTSMTIVAHGRSRAEALSRRTQKVTCQVSGSWPDIQIRLSVASIRRQVSSTKVVCSVLSRRTTWSQRPGPKRLRLV